MEQYTHQEGLTEQFRADAPMEWVQRTNNIQARVREVVHSEVICA
ncbi:TnpV protein [uncultured Neglectibacter sp.]